MNASLHRGCQRLQWASHPADTARSVVAASRSGTACHHTDKCPRQQQPEQQPEQQQHPSAASRRLALAAAALAPLALWCGRASAAGGGLQTAPCGLKWEDLTVGDGPPPIRGAFYKAHYRAALNSTGAEFDNSYAKKAPLIFKVGDREVMEAWDVAILGDEGLPPMREGGTRRIVVPPGRLQQQGTKSLVWIAGLLDALEDAGELSRDGAPMSDLVFEIELLKRRSRS